MKLSRTSGTLLVGAMITALALSGCSSTSGASSTGNPDLPQGDEVSTTTDAALTALLPADVVKKGRINIASDIPFPPMEMYDANNRAIGFDPELARLLGQKLGIDVSINKQAFDSVIPALQAGKNDIIMSGMNDTPERQETLTFIDYTKGGFGIVVPKGNPENISTTTDLCGKTVSVQKATVQGDLLRAVDCGSKPAITLMELPGDLDAQTALRAGKSDAYVVDSVVAEYVAATTNNGSAFEVVRDPNNPAGFNPVYSGIGVLKGNTQLITALQKAFQELIDEGSYAKVLDRNHISSYAVTSAQLNQGVSQ